MGPIPGGPCTVVVLLGMLWCLLWGLLWVVWVVGFAFTDVVY